MTKILSEPDKKTITIDRYRLTLTHELIDGERILTLDEPKVMEFCSCDERRDLASYRERLLDELFLKFREQLKDHC